MNEDMQKERMDPIDISHFSVDLCSKLRTQLNKVGIAWEESPHPLTKE